ncbi:MAG: hypothetical protein Q4P66_03950 [Actinomycetaceae bacterium]|nr:hypothetical protein [Actinomycetaceae bacterium]
MSLRIHLHPHDPGHHEGQGVRVLRGGTISGALIEVLPDVLCLPRLLHSVSGRAQILSHHVKPSSIVCRTTALWLWTAHGVAAPIHVMSQRRDYRYRETVTHLVRPVDRPVRCTEKVFVTSRAETLYDLARTVENDREFMRYAYVLLQAGTHLNDARELWLRHPHKHGNIRCSRRFEELSYKPTAKHYKKGNLATI